MIAYEYVPPTPANLLRTNIRAHHPNAKTRYEFEMPPDFRRKVHPWQRGHGG